VLGKAESPDVYCGTFYMRNAEGDHNLQPKFVLLSSLATS